MTVDIGRFGLWAPLRLWENEGARLADTAAELDALGFGTLWVANGPAVLDVAAAVLDATPRVSVATGIVNIWQHTAADVARHHARITARHRHRFLLGLGNGPREASQWRLSPYERMVACLDELDARQVAATGRILAAVGPRMLALAAARTRGAHPFLTTPEHTRLARAVLGPDALLAPELKVVLSADPARARSVARRALEFYLPKRGYAGNLRRLGFTDDDLAGGGSDRLVDAVVAWGDADAVRRRVDEHLRAGADHVALQVLTESTDGIDPADRRLPLPDYRRLASWLDLGR
ncbi:TIGR03620 family F420-dependent LLM class oxidoreductase [Dactylosporangium sp. NPDC005572]|uniref:TIGR03620 family F420-dependent LLM class oxidoreductase n=1 Tax=Dactylosporangium sp. NPDC005572 TaxID=3156889 RepID=UPI0033A8A2CC